ncbi:hypothetical protein Q1695_001817 [Nippostrongylus brasiliensis]|nr:hypothetical protein Q1695_001817 [Nippostrongylus brasiliensis]
MHTVYSVLWHMILTIAFQTAHNLKCYLKNPTENEILEVPDNYCCDMSIGEPCEPESLTLQGFGPIQSTTDCRVFPLAGCCCTSDLCNKDFATFEAMWSTTRYSNMNIEQSKCANKAIMLYNNLTHSSDNGTDTNENPELFKNVTPPTDGDTDVPHLTKKPRPVLIITVPKPQIQQRITRRNRIDIDILIISFAAALTVLTVMCLACVVMVKRRRRRHRRSHGPRFALKTSMDHTESTHESARARPRRWESTGSFDRARKRLDSSEEMRKSKERWGSSEEMKNSKEPSGSSEDKKKSKLQEKKEKAKYESAYLAPSAEPVVREASPAPIGALVPGPVSTVQRPKKGPTIGESVYIQ